MFEVNYQVKNGLGNLLRCLKKGQHLKGRIVDRIESNGYLLRIRGYNILAQSEASFNKFDEIDVYVQEIYPHLKLNLLQNTTKVKRKTISLDNHL